MNEIGEGRLEVWNVQSGHWSTVCGENWDSANMSGKACKLLGYRQIDWTRIRDETIPSANPAQSRLALSGSGFSSAQQSSVSAKSLFYKGRNSGCHNGSQISVYLRCSDFACGRAAAHAQPTARIVGGNESYPGKWPWLVGLHGGPDEIFFCAGVLLSKYWILSAAHCIGNQTDISGWTVKLGLTRRTASPLAVRRRKVRAVIKHEAFNSYNVYGNDIALLLLDEPVSFDDFLRPVCLPEPDLQLQTSTQCTVIGWGKTRHDEEADYLNVIHEVNLPIINHTQCFDWYTLQDIAIAETMLCAG